MIGPDELSGIASELDEVDDTLFGLAKAAAGNAEAVDAIRSAQSAVSAAASTVEHLADLARESEGEDE